MHPEVEVIGVVAIVVMMGYAFSRLSRVLGNDRRILKRGAMGLVAQTEAESAKTQEGRK